jgi:hypothetical protein
LTALREGSTFTPDRELTKVFSHKPSLVSITDDGIIKHNGKSPGFLYRVAEALQPADVVPHPFSVMETGKEWITRREFKVELITPTHTTPTEQLTEDEIGDLRRMRGAGS